ncbi:MAG: hypothetical protein HYX79_08195 [Chloroflexi bacterium]|nr:hypothetical protein [Chloroflexota bacterium]
MEMRDLILVAAGAILCAAVFPLTLFWDRITEWVSGVRERVTGETPRYGLSKAQDRPKLK